MICITYESTRCGLMKESVVILNAHFLLCGIFKISATYLTKTNLNISIFKYLKGPLNQHGNKFTCKETVQL